MVAVDLWPTLVVCTVFFLLIYLLSQPSPDGLVSERVNEQ